MPTPTLGYENVARIQPKKRLPAADGGQCLSMYFFSGTSELGPQPPLHPPRGDDKRRHLDSQQRLGPQEVHRDLGGVSGHGVAETVVRFVEIEESSAPRLHPRLNCGAFARREKKVDFFRGVWAFW